MSKIFKYDLKIILLKPYVFAMLIVELIYSYLILSSEIILGISDTAPFSGWSFGAFLGKTTMVSLLVSFFILSNLYSKRQKKVSILADVTGFSIRKRMLIRNVIIGGFFLLSNLLIFVEGCIFLYAIFGKIYIGTYIVEWLLITIPCLFIMLGVGNLFGRISPALVYIFMAVIIVMAVILRGFGIDINGANYFEVVSAALESLKGGETSFTITPQYLCTRLMYMIFGIVALIAVSMRVGEKSRISFEK
ncbi:hypothetical protein [Eubacterium ruminantium]|uniref:hypothetical protein n=1 Tax=Eubacterium ruminantium TaxID=42322 RepID=UPI00247A1199|nr:hypothetical protein [Eubacterium ruminantium]